MNMEKENYKFSIRNRFHYGRDLYREGLTESALNQFQKCIDDRYSDINTRNERNTSNTYNGSSENKISAYDSAVYQPNNETTDSNTSSGTDNGTNITVEHTHGNIGVTTTVQMLEQDTNYWRRNNMYQTIAEKFMFTFMITTI